ncbi:acetylornithine deacetylase or succinyl-diaminopimelate desuccinylase [Natrialba chahannaoensis JCM 10990]|uniref:Probable succinyl-diaminopimelate desuccinylase n=1 Tax=Natrialba chahannaoensis JCM 10990 TaxID=1227492 RepID=M0AYZ7_9EURY|nr:ArgE/DapE family deacylase [Natrialba chahannaoensis]ELZ03203.1 acetylornithine deacetylase or succinyl-diaminopimelate desuccinylase [Natrialba chahannaoensis JCM 10990]
MDTTTAKALVDEKIASRESDIVDLLRKLVAAKSVTGNENCGQQVMLDVFDQLDLTVETWEPSIDVLENHPGFFRTSSYEEHGYEGRENAVATVPGTGDGPTLALSGHIDVVPADPESAWESDPWTLRRDGDRVYGRGTSDMKGGLAAMILAVDVLAEEGIELAGDLYVQSTIEEEAGGVGGLLSVLERGYVPDAAIVPEPFGLPNVGIASAGVMFFDVTVPGKKAHAAWGHQGVSAFDKASHVAAALNELNEQRQATIDFPPAYGADPSLEGHVTNINIGVVEGGDWPASVPAEVRMKGRVGWPPGESRAEVRETIEATIDEGAAEDEWLAEHPPTVEWTGWNAAPHEVNRDAEIVDIVTQNAESVTGETGAFVGGNAALDERFYQRYYDVPVVTAGPYGPNLHGVDEYTTVTSLLETARTLAASAIDYCGIAA